MSTDDLRRPPMHPASAQRFSWSRGSLTRLGEVWQRRSSLDIVGAPEENPVHTGQNFCGPRIGDPVPAPDKATSSAGGMPDCALGTIPNSSLTCNGFGAYFRVWGTHVTWEPVTRESPPNPTPKTASPAELGATLGAPNWPVRPDGLSAICGCHPRDHACAERTTAFLATGAPDPSRRGVAEGGVPWTPEAPRRNTQSTGARIHVAPPDQGPHRRPGKGDAFCRRDASSCLHLGTPGFHRFMVGGIPPGSPTPPRRFDSAFCGPAMPPLPTPTQLTVSRPHLSRGRHDRLRAGAIALPQPCLPAASPPDLGAAS
ncbi:hypothetical protein PAPYR_3088 [Paratrimastix pyriformis]|uniref:Uncharacterized protein n=1 Tax=Paratrimastix pyriformis TaxID=342808 RepID=A0ABQ8UVP9_9EUKA|nr:hypothetical protein PAPYR_3088 [Paratrimastix pyriformis]